MTVLYDVELNPKRDTVTEIILKSFRYRTVIPGSVHADKSSLIINAVVSILEEKVLNVLKLTKALGLRE